MNDWLKMQVDNYEIKSALKQLKIANNQNHKLSVESRKILADFYNKVLFYSVGAFSFGTTLIGLVVSDKTEALSKVGIVFPNVWWLYFSLICFFLTAILVMASKKFDSGYIGAFGMENYCEKLKDKEETMIKLLEKYPQQFAFTKNSTSEGEKRIAEKNLQTANIGFLKNSGKRKKFYNIMRTCHVTAESMVIFGSLFMLIFVIQLSQAIVFG